MDFNRIIKIEALAKELLSEVEQLKIDTLKDSTYIEKTPEVLPLLKDFVKNDPKNNIR
jgi:hypothetical protein